MQSRAARPSSVIRLAPAVLVLLVLVGVLTGCMTGDDDDGQDDQGTDAAGELGSKPDAQAQLPDDRGAPPGELTIDDLVVGDGTEAQPGMRAEVHYVGVTWSEGIEFDSSWDRGNTFTFELGAGRVIEGWEQGIEGMAEGGRRVLVIPPELAYGDRGAGEVIGPDEALLFVVDLIAVEAAGEAG